MHLRQIGRRCKAFTLATKDPALKPFDLLLQISDGEWLSAVNSSTLNEAMFVGVFGSIENARGMRVARECLQTIERPTHVRRLPILKDFDLTFGEIHYSRTRCSITPPLRSRCTSTCERPVDVSWHSLTPDVENAGGAATLWAFKLNAGRVERNPRASR